LLIAWFKQRSSTLVVLGEDAVSMSHSQPRARHSAYGKLNILVNNAGFTWGIYEQSILPSSER